MVTKKFQPSQIRNKAKREDVAGKQKKAKTQKKLKERLERAKTESQNPALKKQRLQENVPKTLDNQREFDPTFLTADPSASTTQEREETEADIANDPFASFFTDADPDKPPRILITTSPKASKPTYEFCDELAGVFPGADFIRRKKGKGFEMGRIAGWAADRGYKQMLVVNEDHKQPNAITLIHLPAGPTAYFKLSSIQLTKQIYGHARATAHNPELVLNGFVTRLGLCIGRLFQTCFPPLPEFQGRQVVTLHNQRDFLFFRRHRYAFRSTEKVALQEIGPRFTLKLRWMKKGIPAVQNFGAPAKGLEFDTDVPPEGAATEEKGDSAEVKEDAPVEGDADADEDMEAESAAPEVPVPTQKTVPPTQDEFIWVWKPELETTRRTFFL